MSDQALATQQTAPVASIDEIKERMARNGVMLSVKAQNTINQMKNIDNHFYKVGSYKGPDGQWRDKMEPDAFAIQTFATVQAVNTEVLSVTWENPNDLMNAAVTVRVRGWKGDKQRPEIEKTVELRLAMRAIAMRYVMDKLETKDRWENAPDGSRRKVSGKSEWEPEDVEFLPTGWVEPKDVRKKIAMMSYLTDQYNFIDRTAESKAERRVNLKLLGFDWRDPDEMTDESREVAAVNTQEATSDPSALLEKIEQCQTLADLDALNTTLTAETGKLSPADQAAVMQAAKGKRTQLAPKGEKKPAKKEEEAPPASEPHPDQTTITDLPATDDDVNELIESMKAQETAEGLTKLWNDVIASKNVTSFQRAKLQSAYDSAKAVLEIAADASTPQS